MGDYTEFCFNAELKKDVPIAVLAVLEFLADPSETEALPIVMDVMLVEVDPRGPHEFFNCDRWRWLFVMDSEYFPHKTTSAVFLSYGYWKVNIHSNVKNYDNEIGKFLDWIKPFVEENEDFVGYFRKSVERTPTLIYMKDAKVESFILRR
jgi:hypothetical protein